MSKVLVFCIDALCASDVARMRRMPHFAQILERGALVEKIEPVLPALTYTCHTSILTGTYAGRHGIVHNEKMTRGGHLDAPWYCMKSDVRGKTLLDIARENGLTTCSLSWPVSGGADYTMNMPMIVPYSYQGYQPQQWLEHTATANLMDRYFYKHGRYLMGPTRSLDLFTMALALDILEDGPQPDIMLIKLCDLDSARHTYGVESAEAETQLRMHDEQLGATGIVEKVTADRVYTIEGNTSSAAGVVPNGGCVRDKSYPRNAKYIAGYGRPNWDLVKEEESMPEMTQDKFNEMFKVAMAAYRAELQDNDCGNFSADGRKFVTESGLLVGGNTLPNGEANFMWQDFLTREQFATVLYRFAQKFGLN